jgi:hypothetical protein
VLGRQIGPVSQTYGYGIDDDSLVSFALGLTVASQDDWPIHYQFRQLGHRQGRLFQGYVVSVKNVSGSDWESVSLASNPRFMALIEESRRSHREKGGVGLADIRQEIGIDKVARRRTSAKKRKEAR